MKPMEARYHDYIADWVKNGGALVYCGEDIDPYQSVMEWWNTNGNNYKTPADHLFEKLGLSANPDAGTYKYGKGSIYIVREDPKHFVLKANNDSKYFSTVEKAYNEHSKKGKVFTKNNYYLERGPYVIAAVLDESISDEPMSLSGIYIDLFSNDLPVLTKKVINPGEQAYLYDVKKAGKSKKAQVLCGASRVYDEKLTSNSYSFIAKSPINTTNVSRVLLTKKPKTVTIKGIEDLNINSNWDEKSKTYLVTFENDPDGVNVSFTW
jgi:hypothetical protein